MKNISSFLLGAVISGIITYSITKTKYEKEAQKAINEYKTLTKNKDVITHADTDIIEHDDLVEDEDKNEVVKIISENEYIKGEMLKEFKNKKRDLSKNEKKYPKQSLEYEEDLDDEDEIDEEPPGPTEESDEPYVITYEEYSSENIYYDKKTLIYYYDDDTLVESETDMIVTDDIEILGDGWRNCFDEIHDTEFYIRNESRSTDYEVIIKYCSYNEE